MSDGPDLDSFRIATAMGAGGRNMGGGGGGGGSGESPLGMKIGMSDKNINESLEIIGDTTMLKVLSGGFSTLVNPKVGLGMVNLGEAMEGASQASLPMPKFGLPTPKQGFVVGQGK